MHGSARLAPLRMCISHRPILPRKVMAASSSRWYDCLDLAVDDAQIYWNLQEQKLCYNMKGTQVRLVWKRTTISTQIGRVCVDVSTDVPQGLGDGHTLARPASPEANMKDAMLHTTVTRPVPAPRRSLARMKVADRPQTCPLK